MSLHHDLFLMRMGLDRVPIIPDREVAMKIEVATLPKPLPGNWFTIGGNGAFFFPPGVTLADVQAANPGFTCWEGITPEAQRMMDAADERQREDREDLAPIARLFEKTQKP